MDLKKRKLDENGSPAAAPPGPQSTAIAASTPADDPSPPSVLSPDIARLIVDPLSKDQLVDLVIEASLRHHDILDEVRKFADKEPVHRKIFVRGLGWDTNTDTLKGVFSQFGELEEGIVIFDKNTGRSRGYGFVTFKHMDGVLRALKEPSKKIDGRMTICQLASTGPALAQAPQDVAARKIYVGNVPMEWPADRLLNLFAQYGEIEEGPLGFDKQTGRSRGFALFIYKSPDSARRSLEEPMKLIDGNQLFCKLAAENWKPKAGIMQGQSDVSELSMAQPGAIAQPGMQYAAAPQGMMTTGLLYNQNANPPLNSGIAHMNPAMNPSMLPNIASSNQNYPGSNPPSLNATLPSPINPSRPSQMQTSLGLPSYGTQQSLGPYGPQPQTYAGGQAVPAYPGATVPPTMYNMAPASMASQAPALQGQGQYALGAYQSQQQVPSSASRMQQTGPMPYYGM